MKNSGRMPHALLLTGIAGLGKQRFADKIAASLLCQQPGDNAEACGQCHSCRLLNAGSHPDHTVVAPEETGKQIKVDQIRELKAKQTLMPKVSGWKTVIIRSADSMNISAFNSLLKLLEEPQPQSVLLLISQNPHQLPITIRSRCQTLAMPVPEQQAAIDWLSEQNPQQDEKAWQSLLKLVQGAPLAALTMQEHGLEQIQQVRQDFAALMRAQANPVKLAAAWQQYDLLSIMHQLQHMLQQKLLSLLSREVAVSQGLLKQYWAISDCITSTIKLISSQNNPNKTLLIEDFMVTVMQHADRIKLLESTDR
jgi:DNA polymerase-3 subunit delta'